MFQLIYFSTSMPQSWKLYKRTMYCQTVYSFQKKTLYTTMFVCSSSCIVLISEHLTIVVCSW